ncbi:MAG: tetratricopeptide repeat protein, partial [Acidobacteriota bacterium]|nr:tetratricopeptide repeat protein [Acidobacteriota bacterium]
APSASAAAPSIEIPAAETSRVNNDVAAPAPVEFEIPVAPVESQPAAPAAQTPAAAPPPQATVASPPPVAAPVEEVDLSDEWEAMSQEVAEAPKASAEPAQEAAAETETEAASEAEAEPEAKEPAKIPLEAAPEPAASGSDTTGDAGESPIELVLEETPSEANEIELELAPQPSNGNSASAKPKDADDFLSELNAELEEMGVPSAPALEPAKPNAAPAAPAPPKETVRATSKQPAPAARITPAKSVEPVAPAMAASKSAPEPSAGSLDELAEVFQEFRSELGEMNDEDEDLETHYNLGIAYREMGLLEEAIGEFQKVAQAVQRGKPFAYAMNCAAMLALSFMDKGEPKIAALWYERALKTPGLDQEAVLALRYDLGISLESAGESQSALDNFRQVYAMNIDYRDVADRIAMLQQH